MTMAVKVYDNIPTSYSEAAERLGTADQVTLGHKTTLNRHWADDDGLALAVTYHDTDVLTYYPSGLILATDGGWDTVTTRRRIKAGLAATHADPIVVDKAGWRNRYWIASTSALTAEEWAAVRSVVAPMIESDTMRPWSDAVHSILEDVLGGADPTAITIALNLAAHYRDYRQYLPAALACVA